MPYWNKATIIDYFIFYYSVLITIPDFFARGDNRLADSSSVFLKAKNLQ
jgi:hypothetical protein